METKFPRRFLNRATPPHIVTLILLSGISALAMNVFLPSLPNMTAYFQTDYRLMQLSVALYLGINGAMQIVIGPIADRSGRRPVILWGMVVFLLATLGCIYAPTAEIFLVFRMLQAGVAVGIVLSRAAVRDMYPQDRAASMLGYVTMGVAVVPMVGPAIGGLLDGWFGWTSSFWLMFGLGGVILALTWFDFGETAHKSGKTLVAQFREYPELLRSPRFWGYSLASGFASGAFFAYLGGGPFVGTVIYGMEASQLGLYFGAPAIGYFMGNFLSGRYSVRIGVNKMVLWGCVTILIGVSASVLVMLAGYGSAQSFFGFMIFVGLGNGMSIPNATAGAMSVRPHLAGTASGLSGAIMLIGGAALSGLAGMMLVPETGAVTLLFIMLATAALGVVAIGVVVWRERRLAGY